MQVSMNAWFSMGYASALAWILFAVILLFTWLQFRLAQRWVYYEAGTEGQES
jgi:multiple sugar transport system permease protein